MRKLIVFTLLSAVALCAASTAANAQLKLGTVDMNKVFTAYFKTKDAEDKINDARAAAKKELDDRLETLKKAMDEINKTNQDIEKPELSKDGKEKLASSATKRSRRPGILIERSLSFARPVSVSFRSSLCACERISSTTS
jgi:Skp family chaperone for outer membrane proteins